MPVYSFRDVPGSYGDASASPVNLTNIRQEVPPPAAGAHRELLNALGYPFSGDDAAFRTTRMSRNVLDLDASGLTSRLDMACFRTGKKAGSLVNFIRTGREAVEGGSLDYDGGIKTNGVDNSVVMAANRSDLETTARYKTNDACFFVCIEEVTELPGEDTPILGGIGAVGNTRLTPFGISGQSVAVRINGGANSISRSFSGDRRGLWLVQRTSQTNVAVYHNGELFMQGEMNSTQLPNGLALGREAAHFGDWTVSAFGFGASLNHQQRESLMRIVSAHRAVVKS